MTAAVLIVLAAIFGLELWFKYASSGGATKQSTLAAADISKQQARELSMISRREKPESQRVLFISGMEN